MHGILQFVVVIDLYSGIRYSRTESKWWSIVFDELLCTCPDVVEHFLCKFAGKRILLTRMI